MAFSRAPGVVTSRCAVYHQHLFAQFVILNNASLNSQCVGKSIQGEHIVYMRFYTHYHLTGK